MALVNITKAAKLAGITRQYLHKHYIKGGLISVSQDAKGNPQIDTSEILRVFGKLNDDNDDGNSLQQMTSPNDSDFAVVSARLTAAEQIIRLKDQIIEEKDLRIADLQHSVMLLANNKLESEPAQEPRKRGWFYRFFD